MNFSIRYLTEYRYDSPVTDNLNALRVRPATTSTQRTDDFHVRTDPESRISRHTDYFGTEVIEFGIPKPHDHLTIDVRARVVTSEPPEPPDAPWDALTAAAYEEAGGEFLLPTGDEPPEELLADLHAQVRASSPLATLRLLCELIPDRFRYDQNATYVGSTVEDLLRGGGGVCQDFVHLALVLLRRQGIAARYVSGYLWASREDGGGDSMEVNTHAWLEALMPNTGGRGEPSWVGADPTNRRLAGETHVKVGHGRRYSDVPPIKGVYRGPARTKLDASVQMTCLDPAASARA
ncbi:MAG: transglutaminase family protein [Solirubrobacterales bacterium]|nr:transglutaminase family protein [Solirubrobacterales bacterium]